MTDKTIKAWKCSVCGYVHRGLSPPDVCPVCGAAKADFEPLAETPLKGGVVRGQIWKCLNCNAIHKGSTPPDGCPVCGAHQDRFEPVGEGVVRQGTGEPQKVLIIGAGIAGVSAAESVRDSSEESEITLISKEASLPYYRLNLTRFLAGEIEADALPIHPEQWYVDNRIELMLGSEVSRLWPEKRSIEIRDGGELGYDRLILAMGSHPFVPAFPGATLEGVHTLRTVDDAQHILAETAKGKACVCIGGGVLGIETAGALARRGVDVTLLESHGWLMPRQMNKEAGSLLADHMASLGVRLLQEATTLEIVGDKVVSGVSLSNGTVVAADLVIIATGVRPNSHLARRAGLDVNRGVVVDSLLSTSRFGDIYAAGDVAEHQGVLYGTWAPSQYQGSIAGMNAAGLSTDFAGIPRSNTLKILDVDLLSIGQFEPQDGSYIVLHHRQDGHYYSFTMHDGVMVGAILYGDTSIGTAVKQAVENRSDYSGLLSRSVTGQDVVEQLRSVCSVPA